MQPTIQYGIYNNSTLIYTGATSHVNELAHHISTPNTKGKLSHAQMLVRVILSQNNTPSLCTLDPMVDGNSISKRTKGVAKNTIRTNNQHVKEARFDMLQHMSAETFAQLDMWMQGKSEEAVEVMMTLKQWPATINRAAKVYAHTLWEISERLGSH